MTPARPLAAFLAGCLVGAAFVTAAQGATSRPASTPVTGWTQIEAPSALPSATRGPFRPLDGNGVVAGEGGGPAGGASPSFPAAAVQSAQPTTSVAATVPGAPLPWWYLGRTGIISHMGRSWPGPYLAIPRGKGFLVTICGPAACRTMRSTDAGPNREMIQAGRIADVDWRLFEMLCGCPASRGLTSGKWTIP